MAQNYKIDEVRFKSTAVAIISEYENKYGTREISFEDFFGENYKYSIYENGRAALGFDEWTTDMIGSGKIFANLLKALGQSKNLVYFTTSNFEAVANSDMKYAEQLIYNIYCSDNDEKSFNEFTNFFGHRSDKTAYIFFLKDKDSYLPMSPIRFGIFLDLFGITTKCVRGLTWEHYQEFIDIMRYVQKYLNDELHVPASLVDAHSFIWVAYLLGDQKRKLIQDEIAQLIQEKENLEEELNTPVRIPEIPKLIGKEIQHNKWGQGVINSCSNDNSATVEVKFDDDNIKNLSLKFCIGKMASISSDIDDIIIRHYDAIENNAKIKKEAKKRISYLEQEIINKKKELKSI